MTTNGLYKQLLYFRFLRRHIGFSERGVPVPPTSIPFYSPNRFRKSHESTLLDLLWFHSTLYDDEVTKVWSAGHLTPSPDEQYEG